MAVSDSEPVTPDALAVPPAGPGLRVARPRGKAGAWRVAVVVRDPTVPFADIEVPLVSALEAIPGVVVRRPGGPPPGDAGDETDHTTVRFADGRDPDWTRDCLRHADEIVVVAVASDDPTVTAAEREIAALAARRGAATRLLLLHQPHGHAHDAAAWLAGRQTTPLHVRLDVAADVRRVARLLTGRATALALSGGGARGFAHIGVLRALGEAGIDIDIVTGTSMGAQVGALHALGLNAGEVHTRSRDWVTARPWTDYTLPFASVVRGRRLRRAITHLFGAHRIEDLWVPFACITANLTRASCDTHTSGPLALLVAASNAVPGLAPPVRYGDGLHVDGGLLDNLPVAAARALGAGRVIAVDVSSTARFEVPPRASLDPSGWALAWDLLRGRPLRLPPVHASLTRALTIAADRQMQAARLDADLVLRLPLPGIAASDFHAIDRIVEMGYNEAVRRVTAPPGPL